MTTDGKRLPEITLRRIFSSRAHVILSGRPEAGEQWAHGYPTAGDIEAAEHAIRTAPATDATPFGVFEIVARDGTVLGGAGFHGPEDEEGTVEIGYGVATSVRNKGIASAAVRALVSHARRNGARTVVARAEPENIASQRALERSGFVLEEVDDDRYLHYRLPLSS